MAPLTPLRLLLAGAYLALPCYAINARTKTPAMGWNSYNYYSCSPNETIIKANAKGLVDLGFHKLGYEYITPDCGWPAPNRTADGQITWNPDLFPDGFPALADYVHELGLKFGVYSGGGVWECMSPSTTHLPASLGYEEIDAKTFASWGADALKYDNCWANLTEGFVNYDPYGDPSVHFATMASALDEAERPIVYAICQWGVGEDLGVWASKYGDSWRISNDIQNNWQSIWRITNQVVPYVSHTGVGRYPDMDMLIIGLGALNYEEERFHFGMWAINKSPLIIGAPMNASVTAAESLEILGNEEVIALNQDPLGEQAKLVRRFSEEGYDIWAGALSGSRMVVAVANWQNSSKIVEVDLNAVGIQKAGKVRDVWAASDLGPLSGSVKVTLKAHENKLLVLSNIIPSKKIEKEVGYYAAAEGDLVGAAVVVDCGEGECIPTGSKVVNMTIGSSVTIHGVNGGSTGGTKLVGVDYINYDVALGSAWTNGTNTRNLTLSVNGGTPKYWAFPISGGDWFETGRLDILVDGFKKGKQNEVKIAAPGLDPGAQVVGFAVYEEEPEKNRRHRLR